MTALSAVRRASTLSPGEWRDLAIACAAHLLLRLSLRMLPLKSVLRAGRWRLPVARRAVGTADVERLAGWSTRICGGTCLTESLVKAMLARGHGLDIELTIGVSRIDGAFHAHAWTGDRGGDQSFVPIWPADRDRR
jgi:hypothetical protein